MIPLHPQRVPDRPEELRWVVPPGTIAALGPLTEVPPPLAALLTDGTLAGVVSEGAAITTRLGTGRTWPAEGGRVRTALHAALADPEGWTTAGPAAPDDDALLRSAVQDALTGPVGAFARSHGGEIALVDVRQGLVTVRLHGTCHGCPASWLTLQLRLEREVRRRYAGRVEIREARG